MSESTETATGTETRTIDFDSPEQMVQALGAQDEALRIIESTYPTLSLTVRGHSVQVSGTEPGAVVRATEVLAEVKEMAAAHTVMSAQTLQQLMSMLETAGGARPAQVLTQNILSSRGRTIRPKTLNQKLYVDAIDSNTVIFGIGPAGTGKTYLAMAKAVQALQNREVNRIILTRPAVEAGERLGYLPGTLSDKIDPYLRPLYDALHDMMDPESIPRLMAAGTIEVAPLAYMRGRTLNDAFIILDEAQNTTPEQMKMFLTRLGFGSRIVVTGDVTQVDLPHGTRSGLRVVSEILAGIDDVAFTTLDATDVVRHRLVGDIVNAYSRWDEQQRRGQERSRERLDHGRARERKRADDAAARTRPQGTRESAS
ncbi:phosphate starvation-inducible protein PhoH [Tersicoccus phoenicis]|uniref:PhoH-like protein n=1 Tax=Tersicoccus phoenicis TaxID=554083 RepID=A0A1R1LET2_9MICC|nr:PhoH family protein [Tersicoccus phoenicis]OMH26032.1 phosphate starvation-inducible protein PhoH [Tersicoccus phoenicis]